MYLCLKTKYYAKKMPVVFSNSPNAGRAVGIYKYTHNFGFTRKSKVALFSIKMKA